RVDGEQACPVGRQGEGAHLAALDCGERGTGWRGDEGPHEHREGGEAGARRDGHREASWLDRGPTGARTVRYAQPSTETGQPTPGLPERFTLPGSGSRDAALRRVGTRRPAARDHPDLRRPGKVTLPRRGASPSVRRNALTPRRAQTTP